MDYPSFPKAQRKKPRGGPTTSAPLLHPGLANKKAHPSRHSDFYAVEWGMVLLRPTGIFLAYVK